MADLPTCIDHVNDGIFISGVRAAYYTDDLRRAGIRHVLALYQDEAGSVRWPADFTVLHNGIQDSMPVPAMYLRSGVDFVHRAAAAGENVLVCCWAGISRSSTFVLAYLIETGFDLPDAWYLLSSRHTDAWPAMELWQSLLEYYQLPYTLADVHNWLKWDGHSG